MPIDRRKQFIKLRKKRKGVYQSNQVPEHFQNEGDEYLGRHPNEQDSKHDTNDTKDNVDFDKIVGNKSAGQT